MSKRNLYLAATVACLTGALFGYSVGFIGGILVLPSFLRHFHLDTLPPADLASSEAIVVSSWIVGCFFGVPLAMPICSRFGRKPCLLFTAILYILGAVLQLVDVHSRLGVFEVGRVVNGLGVGAGTLVTPIYIAEISRPADRSVLMSGFQVAVQVCALLGFWSAYAANALVSSTSNLQWQIPVAVQLVPAAILLLGASYVPETPHYLAANGKNGMVEIQRSLAWFRGREEDDTEVLFEANEIHRNALASRRAVQLQDEKSFLREAFSRPIRKRLGVGVGLMVAQNVVGLNALNYYCAVIFMTAGFKSVSSSLFLTGVFGLVKVIAAASFMFIFVRVRGNRFWLILGSSVCAISMLILGACVLTMPADGDDAGSHPGDDDAVVMFKSAASVATTSGSSDSGGLTVRGAIAVVMVYIFAFSFGISLGPISWNVCSEIFPSRLNAKCCMVTTCTQWLFQILIAAITPILLARVGAWTFVLYGVCCVLSLVWCAVCVPETRGVGIGREMDEVFGEGDGGGDEEGAVEEVEDVMEVSERTSLMGERMKRRRRSSVAIVV